MAILYPDQIYSVRVRDILFTGNIISVGKDGNYLYDYSTITAAVNAAIDGDMILIYPGTYQEDLTCTKSLIFRGMSTSVDQVIWHQNANGYNDNFLIFSFTSASKEIILENFYVESQTAYSWASNINVGGLAGTFRMNKIYSFVHYNTRYPLKLNFPGKAYATNCQLDAGYAHIVDVSASISVFSLLKMQYNSAFSCYNCGTSPSPHDYVTSLTYGYGFNYGDYLVEFILEPESAVSAARGNLSINSYNIFQATNSGVNIYDLSGNRLGVLTPSGVDNEVNSVYADDDYLYVGTSLSGIYYTTASGALYNSLIPFKQFPDINDNEII